ncbi:TPA: hypothetical protein I7285_03080 [Vibrio parahaemolyticus]|nr:hypothetical protein [Vibrio parahaemolyticus]ELB2259742.1 hypothetical protein [Vibrio parahaemolyticus]HAS6904129.1 hypothetical protein [Vibrio parahaemolyticus]
MNTKDIKIQSIHNMMNLLMSIESNPEKYIDDEGLLSIISTQSLIAKASLISNNIEDSIYPMSLNTQKSLCEIEFIDGYKKFNKQRRKAIAEINKLKNKDKAVNIKKKLSTDELNQKLMIENSMYVQIIDYLRSELKRSFFIHPDNPETEFESINKIINLKLKHIAHITNSQGH